MPLTNSIQHRRPAVLGGAKDLGAAPLGVLCFAQPTRSQNFLCPLHLASMWKQDDFHQCTTGKAAWVSSSFFSSFWAS